MACFLAGILMSSFGRRGSTLYFTIPCYFFGYIIIGSASNYMMLIGPISLLNICDLKNLKTNLNLGLKLLPITDIGDVNMIFYF